MACDTLHFTYSYLSSLNKRMRNNKGVGGSTVGSYISEREARAPSIDEYSSSNIFSRLADNNTNQRPHNSVPKSYNATINGYNETFQKHLASEKKKNPD